VKVEVIEQVCSCKEECADTDAQPDEAVSPPQDIKRRVRKEGKNQACTNRVDGGVKQSTVGAGLAFFSGCGEYS
jgi:hypothetical protein